MRDRKQSVRGRKEELLEQDGEDEKEEEEEKEEEVFIKNRRRRRKRTMKLFVTLLFVSLLSSVCTFSPSPRPPDDCSGMGIRKLSLFLFFL